MSSYIHSTAALARSTKPILSIARVCTTIAMVFACMVAPLAARAHSEVGEEIGEEDPRYLLDEIVVVGTREDYSLREGSSGTKTPTPLIDTPQAIIALTRDQLDDQALSGLNDALRYIPGVSLETGEGHRDEVFIRGQETTADFYLDGLRDDAQYYRSLYNIERVEVLKGANALIFGRGAGGGAVNRVRKQPQADMTMAVLKGQVDSFAAYSLAGDVNSVLGDGLAARLNIAYEDFNNHRSFYSGRFFGIAPSIAWQGATTRLVLDYSYDDDSRLVDRGIPALDGAPLFGQDRTFFGDVDFNRAVAKVHIARARLEQEATQSLSLNATVHYGSYDKIYANILPRAVRGDDNNMVQVSGYQDAQTRENWIVQGNLIWQVATGSVEHTILFGIEALWQSSTNRRTNVLFADSSATSNATRLVVDIPTASDRALDLAAIGLSDPIRQRASDLSSFSVYLQNQIRFATWLEVIVGVRYERVALDSNDITNSLALGRRDSRFSPRVGLIIKPQESLSLYGSYSTSFRPQSGDQFLVLSNATAALDPELFTSWEIGGKWAPSADIYLSAAMFQLDRDRTRSPDPSNSGLLVQVGKSRVRGFEVNLAGQLVEGFHINAGYSYLDGTILTTSSFGDAGRRLQQVPRHQIGLWGRYDISDSIGVGLGLIHQSAQFASFSNAVSLPAYARVDAAVYWTVSERLSLQVNIENLFDKHYYPSAHGDNNIAPARPFHASLSLRLTL